MPLRTTSHSPQKQTTVTLLHEKWVREIPKLQLNNETKKLKDKQMPAILSFASHPFIYLASSPIQCSRVHSISVSFPSVQLQIRLHEQHPTSHVISILHSPSVFPSHCTTNCDSGHQIYLVFAPILSFPFYVAALHPVAEALVLSCHPSNRARFQPHSYTNYFNSSFLSNGSSLFLLR